MIEYSLKKKNQHTNYVLESKIKNLKKESNNTGLNPEKDLF